MSAWPPEQTVVLKLPSGKEIQARLPDEEFLGMCGLAMAMAREERGEVLSADISDPQAVDIAHAMAAVLTYACAKPKLSLEPHGPDEIHPDNISMDDAVFIVRWALRRGLVFERHFHNHRTNVDRKGKRHGVRFQRKPSV